MMNRSPFDAEAIRELAAILLETGLTEIEVSDKDRRLRVVRTPAPAVVHAAVTTAPVASGVVAPVLAMVEEDEATNPDAVTSPMVGVAYLSPEPGLPPYVVPGQAVQAGQTVMLIEAMKTFNQIKALRAGTVARVLVESGQAVEYGQALLVIT